MYKPEIFEKVKDCTECKKYYICTGAMYGSLKCNPEPKEKEESESRAE